MSTAPPVIVHVPKALGDVEILVRHEEWDIEVDVRPAGTSAVWTPIALLGGTVTVRKS